ncbi:hypothetical protein M0R45_001003 [Rubus argutus]|uniref:Uncharacterized protein n=1 Tax=Rubus argutus TaxID=59490 RepID=A0AAW1VLT3_RUBAR
MSMLALSSVASVCGSIAMLEQGKQLHAHVLSVGLDCTAMVQSAVVNMYSKWARTREIEEIYDVTERDDVVLWNARHGGRH